MEETIKPSKRVIARTKKNRDKITELGIILIIINALLAILIILDK
jgi:hypothetical protein